MNSQQLKDLRLPGQLKLHSMGLVRALIPESARSFTSAFDVTRNEDNTSDGVPSENSRIGRAPGYQSLESRYSERKSRPPLLCYDFEEMESHLALRNKTSIGKIIIRARVLGMVFRRRHISWALTKEAADGVF